jgi:hypothetical protein
MSLTGTVVVRIQHGKESADGEHIGKFFEHHLERM